MWNSMPFSSPVAPVFGDNSKMIFLNILFLFGANDVEHVQDKVWQMKK